jgi:hypothetical protein
MYENYTHRRTTHKSPDVTLSTPGNGGARKRLRALAARVADSLRTAVGKLRPSDGSVQTTTVDRQENEQPSGSIQVRGQRQLEGKRRQRKTAQLHSSGADDNREVEASLEGDRLRIQESDSSDAYISSDVYERIER